ncbi:MAG: porin family protein [Idiomarina sp.]|nr:porin family protein [Idiomarina sp.]
MKLTLFAALTLSAVTFSATAQTSLVPTQHQPSFNFVQAGYQSYDMGTISGDLDGFALRGSFEFTEQLFATLDYEDLSGSNWNDGFGASSDTRELYLNLGYQFYQQGSTSLYATAGLAWYEFKANYNFAGLPESSFSDDDTGFNALIGVRHRFTEYLEVDASVRHVDIGGDSEQIFSLSGRYYINPRFSIDARYTRIDSDLSGVGIGASYHF